MKHLITTALFALVSASAAHADIKVEPRVFHSNFHLSSVRVSGSTLPEKFLNTAGAGVSGIMTADENVDLGLGYGFARHYDDTYAQIDNQSFNAFARYKLIQASSHSAYALLGVSNHQIDRHFETERYQNIKSKITMNTEPLWNGDIGLGGSLKVGGIDLGLEYKYSQSLSQATARLKAKQTAPNGTSVLKAKAMGLTIETHELALTLGLSI